MPRTQKAKAVFKRSSKPKRAPGSSTLKTAPPGKVRVRTYRHGLGDCHLVTFRKPDGSPFNLLIDCGVVSRTKNPGPLMADVANNIKRETNGILDVVVATHQHTDHLSGFRQASNVFKPMKMH